MIAPGAYGSTALAISIIRLIVMMVIGISNDVRVKLVV